MAVFERDTGPMPLFGLALALLAGCTVTSEVREFPVEKCQEGTFRECSCDDGAPGTQRCVGEHWDACACEAGPAGEGAEEEEPNEGDEGAAGEGAEEEEPNQGDDDGAGDEGAAGEGEGEGEGEPQGPLCTGADPTGAPILDRSAVPPNCGRPAATCPGAPMPYWQLADFQPQSCGFEEVYSLDAFVGTRTVVALFAAS